MNIISDIEPEENAEHQFPCIMAFKPNPETIDIVVKFFSPRSCVVLWQNSRTESLSLETVDGFNINASGWVPFHGNINLLVTA